MSQIASKNLYDLLGNDPELDPDREPEPPTKVIDKPVQRTGKRNGGTEAPDAGRPAVGGRGGRTQNSTRGDQAGSTNNRADQRDDGLRKDRHPDRVRDSRDHRGGERGRGPRGERRGRGRGDFGGTRPARDDRHSHTGIGDHEKQAAHGWGGDNANAEWTDEKAGAAIAEAEVKNEVGFTPDVDAKDPAFSNGPDLVGDDGDAAAAEAEEKTKSYDQYLAEQAEKRLALSSNDTEIRKANEGSKQKFPQGKAHHRDPEDEHYMAGSGGKSRREKEIKQKNLLTVDGQYYAAPDAGDRGGRGGGAGGGRGRGGRGRGEGRGEFRGRGGGRGRGGDTRGAHRGDGPRGDGPRGGSRGGFNATDQSAFPALGGA